MIAVLSGKQHVYSECDLGQSTRLEVMKCVHKESVCTKEVRAQEHI